MSPFPRRTLTLLAALIGAGLTPPALAGDAVNLIIVTTGSDSMNAFDQACSLREALANANTNTQFSPVVDECAAGSGTLTDVIRLQSGIIYTLSIPGNDNESGDLDVLDDPELADTSLDLRIEVDGEDNAGIRQSVAGQRVLQIHGARVEIVASDIYGGDTAEVGGGIMNDAGTVSLRSLSIFDNDAVSGGGLYSDGDATLDDVSVNGNRAQLIGGGVYHGDGTLVADQSGFTYNEASTGAGLYLSNSIATLTESTIDHNAATGDGGGILNTGESDLTLTDVDVSNNTSQTDGGGIYTDSSNDMRLVRTDFADNEATLDGGAVASLTSSDVVVDDGTFTGNSAGDSGGAIWAGYVRMYGPRFEGNTAGESGGALYGSNGCTVEDAVMTGNSAQQNGGAIACQIADLLRTRVELNLANERGGGIHVTNWLDINEGSIVSNAALIDGGGVWLETGNFDSHIARTLFDGNGALNDGGGVWLGADASFLAIANSTLSGNVAANGAGSGLYIDTGARAFAYNTTFAANGPTETIAKYGDLTLQNSIIDSTGLNCVAALDDPSIISLGNNLASDTSCVGLDASSDDTGIDPLLAPLANNGGNTRTHALLEGSPAIDAANNAGCHGTLTLGVDQRGAARPEPFGCDIGAHEQEVPMTDIFADGFED